MPELAPLDRLQPALLDRLSDDDPHKTLETRDARVIGRQRLRAAVLRDLNWLFNATRPSEPFDPDRASHAERSVVNYGLPALSGETASTLDVAVLEQRIHRAIVHFEPRIDPSSLRVQALVNQIALDHHNQIQIEIHASLWSQPVPIELLLRTEVDLETGQVNVEDVTR